MRANFQSLAVGSGQNGDGERPLRRVFRPIDNLTRGGCSIHAEPMKERRGKRASKKSKLSATEREGKDKGNNRARRRSKDLAAETTDR